MVKILNCFHKNAALWFLVHVPETERFCLFVMFHVSLIILKILIELYPNFIQSVNIFVSDLGNSNFMMNKGFQLEKLPFGLDHQKSSQL